MGITRANHVWATDITSDSLLVDEDSIALANPPYLERKKIVVEDTGAVTLVALLKNKDRFAGKKDRPPSKQQKYRFHD